MNTEYGVQDVKKSSRTFGEIRWMGSREEAEDVARRFGHPLVAREVSEPRVVSIRG